MTTAINFMTGLAVIAGLVGVWNSSASFAQTANTPPIIYQPNPDSPIGERNAKAPGGQAQFDFVIGDWDVDITWAPKNAAPATYKAKWHNSWIINGQVVMQEWRGPYLTGAELRSYNPETDSWAGRNIYPAGGGWKPTTAKFADRRMVVIISGAADKDGAFLNRETYFDITAGRFQMQSDKSYDNGKTWVTGDYKMIAKKAD